TLATLRSYNIRALNTTRTIFPFLNQNPYPLVVYCFPTRRSSDLEVTGRMLPQPVHSAISAALPHADDRTGLSDAAASNNTIGERSEEHTSELQSLAYHVCRLLLQKRARARGFCLLFRRRVRDLFI